MRFSNSDTEIESIQLPFPDRVSQFSPLPARVLRKNRDGRRTNVFGGVAFLGKPLPKRQSEFMRRRHFIAATASVPGLLQAAQTNSIPNRLAATDWTIGGRGKLEAFDLAIAAKLDGLQISFQPEPDTGKGEYDLRTEAGVEAVLEKSEGTGIGIASTAMGVFNSHPFKEIPQATEWARAGIDATRALGRDVMLLAFFGKNDLKNDEAGTAETIRRLKDVAPHAEERGVTLGLETTLDLAEHLHIIESVGSPAVQVYYDLGNSKGNGYPIYEEIRQLGSEMICEVHCKDKAGWLFGSGEVDFAKALAVLREIGYEDWFVLEGRPGEGLDALETLRRNGDYLAEIGYVRERK